jgi:cyanoexosortase B-associated protein
MTSGRWQDRFSSAKIAILLFFAIVLCVGALPSYLQGQLPSASTIGNAQLQAINAIMDDGLTLEGWDNKEVTTLELGSYTWLQQTIQGQDATPNAQRQALLFVHPQKSPSGTSSLPQTEWSDIEGVLSRQGMAKLDAWSWLSFPAVPRTSDGAKTGSEMIHARFYRVVTSPQTYATVAWYDWSEGGHYSGARWFLADLRAQIAGTRRPWAAVTFLIPIEARGNIEESRDFATDLAQTIHIALGDAGLAEAAP